MRTQFKIKRIYERKFKGAYFGTLRHAKCSSYHMKQVFVALMQSEVIAVNSIIRAVIISDILHL